MADTRSPGFTWGTVEHLFSIHLGLVAGVATTAMFGAWVGTGLIVLIVAFTLWVTWHVTPSQTDRRPPASSSATKGGETPK